MSGLPKGWSEAPLGDCVEVLDRKRIPLNREERDARIDGKDQADLVPYFGATGKVGYIDDFIFDEEILLLGEDGAPFHDRTKEKAYIVRGKSWVNNHAHVLVAHEEVSTNLFLKHYLDHFDYHGYVTGTTRLKLNQGALRTIPVPLPPLPEQRRIVARIEELFSRLDAGVAALRHAKTQLQRYRQSVLAAAVTGQLTQAWREQHPENEPAEELLERILKQRREQWNGRGKYKEPKGIDAEDFTPLPEGWVWSSGEQHFDWSSGKGLTKKEQQPGEVPVIGGNGVLGTHSEANVMTPTLVVGRVGAQCGNVYRTSAPAWITDNAIYATFVPEAICLRFIEMAFRAANLNSRAGGSGQPFVNQGTLNELEIALPPLAEQLRIVDEVEARTTAIDHLEAELDRQITRSNRLRQSTLASAFDGRL